MTFAFLTLILQRFRKFWTCFWTCFQKESYKEVHKINYVPNLFLKFLYSFLILEFYKRVYIYIYEKINFILDKFTFVFDYGIIKSGGELKWKKKQIIRGWLWH